MAKTELIDTAEILKRLFPLEIVEEMAEPCDKCGLAKGMHRKTISGQTFWLGCDHARWLADAIEKKNAP